MKYLIVIYCFLLTLAICLSNTTPNPVPHAVKNLFENVTLSPAHDVTNKPEEQFAEGGSHNSNKAEPPLNLTEASSIDLIGNGAPSGTSGIKPRKGVHAKIIIARKGALCEEGDDCKPIAVPASNESSPPPPPVYEPQNVFSNNATVASPLPLKPTVTLVPADSDSLYETLKSERNVIIPIVALICAPIIVLIGLVIYKRIQDSRGNSQYMRMGFLIEDIYND